MRFKSPKGTRDFFPDDMNLRRWIMNKWDHVSQRNGFVEYDGPIFEDLDLYRVKSGDEIVDQLFHFTDRGGRELAIRPEMTPTLARMVAARVNSLPKPIKWYSQPRLCRAERPQRGRLREFFQWNIDIIGEQSELADAECIFVLVDFFRELNLSPEQVEIKLNSREIVASLLAAAKIPEDKQPAVYAALDKRDKLSTEAFEELLSKIELDSEQKEILKRFGESSGPEGLEAITTFLSESNVATDGCESVRRVMELLVAFDAGDYCRFDMGVVRGLAYYTGVVFEAFGKGGLRRAVGGGGRYDQLIENMGGPSVGAVGFATSDVVIADLLSEFDRMPAAENAIDYFVIDADPSVFNNVLNITAKLRDRGLSASFSYLRQGVGKQFKQAASRNAARVIIVEGDFEASRTVGVKDMATSNQETLALDAFLDDPSCEIGSDG
ncbi:MAG: histidine--tRNA ligase [Phycisphaerae bacterium]|nr:MAG: histidine--tRNA ligase [Phycisphaerae bacterium]